MGVQLASHVPKMASDDGVVDAARKAIGKALLEARDLVGEITLVVERERIVDVCRALRDTPGLEYQQLMEIAGVDYPGRAKVGPGEFVLATPPKGNRFLRFARESQPFAGGHGLRFDNFLVERFGIEFALGHMRCLRAGPAVSTAG